MKSYQYLILTALFSVTGNSNAALNQSLFNTNGENELFLQASNPDFVFAPGVTGGLSYVLDLNVSFAQLVNGTANGSISSDLVQALNINLSNDIKFQRFITGIGSSINQNRVEFSLLNSQVNSVSETETGIFITSNSQFPQLNPSDITLTPSGFAAAIAQHGSLVASALATNESVSITSFLIPSINQLVQSIPGEYSIGTFGTAVNFNYIFSTLRTVDGILGDEIAHTFDATQDQRVIGNFLLTSSGLSFTPSQISAVPVPGAIWLFASSLIGFYNFNSRKKQS
ncbi:MAG: hypothetical protein CTY34_05680 [Methylobacter sp.]|nr:MAG: hypothetical protein CTY34_05680 [Methylobacter sp.]PPD21186.1 MAG: hypothetical protein CTY24_08170 [Methylobacter sp.]